MGNGLVRSACARPSGALSCGSAVGCRGDCRDSGWFERPGHRRVRAAAGRIGARCAVGGAVGLRPGVRPEERAQSVQGRSEHSREDANAPRGKRRSSSRCGPCSAGAGLPESKALRDPQDRRVLKGRRGPQGHRPARQDRRVRRGRRDPRADRKAPGTRRTAGPAGPAGPAGRGPPPTPEYAVVSVFVDRGNGLRRALRPTRPRSAPRPERPRAETSASPARPPRRRARSPSGLR